MKILVITNDYPNPYFIGGQGVVVRETARILASKGHHVRVLGADRDHKTGWEKLPAREFDDGVEIVRLEAHSWPKQVRKFRLLPPTLRIRSVVTSAKHFLWADVAHFHNFWATGFLMPLYYVARLLRKPYVFSPYYEDYMTIDPWQSYSYEKLLRLFCSHARKVIVLSKREAEILSRFTADAAVVPPGIDSRIFLSRTTQSMPDANTAPLILCVGAIGPRKNYVTIAKSLARVSAPWELAIVSSRIADQAYYDEFKTVCGEAGIDERVKIIERPSGTELIDLHRQAYLFLMPSLWESFGIAAAEAMACGTPTILSAECMITEFIDGGRDAVIVNPLDDEEIAAAVEEMLRDKERARAIGNAGREAIGKHFTWEMVAHDFEEIYRQAVPGANG